MRIEILVDNEDPQIFPFNKPKILIGSQDSCDIVLQYPGMSRRHLIIENEDNVFYVIDQGSTNGTFINEERLVPGRRVEFTSFFPVRLGDNVLVTLLSDAEASDLGFIEPIDSKERTLPNIKIPIESDATQAISLRDLQSGRTEKLLQKRQETVVKRKSHLKSSPKTKKQDKNRMFWVQLFCIGIVGAAAYYNFYIKTPEVTEIRPVMKVGEVEKIKPVVEAPRFPIVSDADFTPKARFNEIFSGMSCISDIEKYLCEKFVNQAGGAIQVGTMVHVFLDGSVFYDQAKNLIPPLKLLEGELQNPEKENKYRNDIKFTAFMLFLRERTPKDLDYEMLKGLNLTFALKFPGEQGVNEYTALVIVPASLEKLVSVMIPKQFEMINKHGADALLFMKEYFKIY